MIDSYILAIQQITFGAFVILFLICRDLLNCLRSIGTMVIRPLIINNSFIMTHIAIFGPLVLAGRVLWIRVCPSVLLWKFSWDWLISFFLKLNMVLGAYVLLCMTGPDFFKKIFLPEKWESGPKMGQKQGFLNLLDNLVINCFEFCL